MVSAKCLLAVAALAVLASARVEVEQDVFKICKSIETQVGQSNVPIDSAEEVFEFAKSKLSEAAASSPEETKLQLERLIQAWDNVVNKGECSEGTFDEVLIIAQCQASDNLKTLPEATKRYTKKCLKPEELASKIRQIAQQHPDVQKAIDSKFIEAYRKENPKEPKIFLGSITGPDCCKPKRAVLAFVNAIASDFPDTKKEFFPNFLVSRKKKLVGHLTDHLFTPCKKYVSAMENLVFELWFTLDLLEQKEEELFELMGPETRNDMFRYKLCINIQDLGIDNWIANRLFSVIRTCDLKNIEECKYYRDVMAGKLD